MGTKDETYQGWANWETWNVALWFANYEPLYLRLRVVFKKDGKFTAASAKMFVQLELPRGTQDFKNAASREGKPVERYTRVAYERVDWRAIADDFNEMGGS